MTDVSATGATSAPGSYRYPDAFRLLSYRSRSDVLHVEKIWNSRDGFILEEIVMRDGSMGRHAQLIDDPVIPAHQPQVGDRIIVNMTVLHARQIAAERAPEMWKNGTPFGTAAQLNFRSELELTSWIFDNLLMDMADGVPVVELVTPELAAARDWKQQPPPA